MNESARRAAWKSIREMEYREARGCCESCGKLLARVKAWDVIARPLGVESRERKDATLFVACRSCRCKLDAGQRIERARRTRIARKAQQTFPWGGKKRGRRKAAT